MVFVIIVNILVIVIGLAVAQCLIKCTSERLLLAGGDLVQHCREINWKPVSEDTLAEYSNYLDMHPSNKGLSVMRLAPSGQTTAHTVNLNLKLFQSHGGPAGLRRIIIKFSDDVSLLAAGLGKFFQKVSLCARGELLSLKVTSLVLSLQNGDGIKSTVGILLYKLQRARNNRRSTLAVSVNLRSELALLTKACGVGAPVRAYTSGAQIVVIVFLQREMCGEWTRLIIDETTIALGPAFEIETSHM